MDSTQLFPDLPDAARVWVQVADRPLSGDEQRALMERLEAFATTWRHHRYAVESGFVLTEGRLLIVAGHIAEDAIGGCGIDAVVNQMDRAAAALGFGWAGPLDVAYRDAEGHVRTASRARFRALATEGAVTAATPVLDPSLTTLGALRRGDLERPAAESWHARVFRLTTESV